MPMPREEICLPRRHALFLALMAAVTFVVYGDSLSNDFHFDDSHTIVENWYLRSLKNIPTFFTSATPFSSLPQNRNYRPVVTVSLALNYSLGGLAPLSYHYVQIALHVLTGFLWYCVAYSLLCRSSGGDRVGASAIAAIGSLIFLVHPLNSEAVNYISCRSSILATLFFLSAFIFYMRYRELGAWQPLCLSALCLVFSLLSKAIGITFIIITVLYDRILAARGARRASGNTPGPGRAYRLIAAVTLLTGGVILWMTPARALESRSGIPALTYLMTQCKVIVAYLGLVIFPIRLSADRTVELSSSFFSLQVLIPLALIIGAIVWLWSVRKRAPEVTFFGLWFFITLLPESSIFSLAEPMNEHRPYIAIGGALFALLACVVRVAYRCAGTDPSTALPTVTRGVPPLPSLPPAFAEAELRLRAGRLRRGACAVEDPERSRRDLAEARVRVGGHPTVTDTLRIGATIIILTFSWLTWERNLVWRDGLTLWSNVIGNYPHNGRAWNNYGLALKKAGRIEEAAHAFDTGLVFYPNYSRLYINRALIHLDRNELPKAFADFKKAEQVDPQFDGVYYYTSLYYERLENYPEAALLLTKAIQFNPAFAPASYRLGEVYRKSREWSKAIEAYDRFLKLDPSSKIGKFWCGFCLINAGDYPRAIRMYQMLLDEDSSYLQARYNLAYSYMMSGQYNLAEEHFKKVLAALPGDIGTIRNLAIIAQKTGAKAGMNHQGNKSDHE
ncbi:MAG: tetratricopeptide repeat protein [Candidatus Aureabacteria bacterium]|nr:tetratricopeptide repeat protein [Candidatus Auribacterota bacterium]